MSFHTSQDNHSSSCNQKSALFKRPLKDQSENKFTQQNLNFKKRSFQFDSHDENDSIVADINMTPLIDIMLVLLIIFMVTSSISIESGMQIDLPKVSKQSGVNSEQNSAVILSLNNKEEVFVQGKKINIEKVIEEIKIALKDSKTDLVIFEGDLHSTLGKTVNLMDLAKKAGALRFAIATNQDT